MLNFFKKDDENKNNNMTIISLSCLLIHAARIDEAYTEKERQIIKDTILKLGADEQSIDEIIKKAEKLESNSIQILEFTKQAKNLDKERKIILLEALWNIIYSDENADLYETNLMRRLAGLLYIDTKIMGDIKKRIKNQNSE